MEVTSVTVCEAPTKPATTVGAPSPTPASTLGVKVRLTGHYESGIPANYFYASLLSRDGTRYLPATEGCRPLLSGAPLRPGETREGYANFPIAARKGADRLAYAPNLEHTAASSALPSSTTQEVPLP